MKLVSCIFIVFLTGIIMTANISPQTLDFADEIPHGDKFCHFFLIGTLALLVKMYILKGNVYIGRLRLSSGTLLVSAFMTLEELSQLFLVNRSFSLMDLMANYAGIFLIGFIAPNLMRQTGKLPA